MADHLLGHTPSGQSGESIQQIVFAVEKLLAFIYLHCVAKGSGSPRNDRDLLDRSGIVLRGGDHRMTYLVIGNDPLFLSRDHSVLSLLAGHHHLDAFLKILGCRGLLAKTHGAQGGLVDYVGEFGSG